MIDELFFEALQTLTVNKLRTFLAVLGIVIGIGSVIALISLGQGSQRAVEQQIQSLGANLLTVMPSGQRTGGVQMAMGSSTTLTLEDAEAIKSKLVGSSVKSVSPEVSSRKQVIAGKNNTNTQIIGALPEYAAIHSLTLQSGSFLTTSDNQSIKKVAVLGSQTAIDLFGNENDELTIDPIGQSIRISGQVFTVVGMMQSKGGTGFNNPDDAIYIPLSTAQKQIMGSTALSTISVEATSKELMVQAQDDIGYLLLERHKLNDPTQADFRIFSQNDILSTASQVTGTFTALLGGIAAISLVVGGIGIMNIMLVTVTERTREIGLRKALGAKKRIIIYQFLIESVLLTILGGFFGMVIGISASFILTKVLSMPFAISVSSLALAIGVSACIGIVFGWYPAQKASNLQPIEALRYE